jgi:hypothetical protein
VPLFDALVDASPAEAGELSCRISSWNDSVPLADEPLLEPVAALLVGVVSVLLLTETLNSYSVPILLTVDVPELSAPVAGVVPELAPSAEVLMPEPVVGTEVVGAEAVGTEAVGAVAVGAELGAGEPGAELAAGPPWLPSPPCPASCWKSLKSVWKSFNKVWKSAPSDE